MSKLPCEVVRDLFPSYIDGLIEELTSRLIEEHVEECEPCRSILHSMKNPEAEPVEETGKEEIDFLKKTRKKNRRNIGLAVLAAVMLLSILVMARRFFIGVAVPEEYVVCQFTVDGKELNLRSALADDGLNISEVIFSEENGVVTISMKSVEGSPFSKDSVEKTYTAERDITEVWLGERILWADGTYISAITSAVYQTAHPYIGNMPENGRTAQALNMGVYLGSYKTELQTETAPYGWKFLLNDEVSNLLVTESYMESCAYVLLAVIENLGEVTYEYECVGVPMTMTVTKEIADAYAGQDIKAVGKDIVLLQQLIEKAELANVYALNYNQWNAGEEIWIDLVNLTKEEFCSVSATCYVMDNPRSSQGTCNADGSMLKEGAVVTFELRPESFAEKRWEDVIEILVGISVEQKDGTWVDCVEKIALPKNGGYSYQYSITGSREEGYHISQ